MHNHTGINISTGKKAYNFYEKRDTGKKNEKLKKIKI